MRSSTHGLLASSLLVLGSFALACTSAGPSAGTGAPGSSSGANGSSGSSGSSGADGGAAATLPASTFLYVSKATPDHDLLMAYDSASGQVRMVMDLRGDGSDGWPIAGYGISADRTRIAVSSLYGATQADVDTMLPTQHVWHLRAGRLGLPPPHPRVSQHRGRT